jgi:hypothetical protein
VQSIKGIAGHELDASINGPDSDGQLEGNRLASSA